MSKTRIESFSDGVFSIVLTLLVFSLRVPKLSGIDVDHELYLKLLSMRHYFAAYVLSFALISMFWIAHHSVFSSMKHSDQQVLWLNNLFLLFLALLPFPTQVLGAYPNTESAAIFFGIEMVLTSLSFSLLRYYVFFHRRLLEDFVSLKDLRNSLIKDSTVAILYIFAIAISAYREDITLSMYALIPFLLFVPLRTQRKSKSA